MPNVTHNPQSFLIDGKRLWLTSGSIHYATINRDLWRSRIQAAKQAGFNTIETSVVWAIHETQQGYFDFEGQKNLREFIEIIADEGLWAIIRPGPYVGGGWTAGGLPAWLLRSDAGEKKQGPVKLRQSDPAFLAASSRYLSAVMEQIKDLQATVPTRRDPRIDEQVDRPAGGYDGSGAGPILMMQAEQQWRSENPEQEETYLRQIVRYLRENGCEVPILANNQLMQPIEGALDVWSAGEHLSTDLRQLKQVQPDTPSLVIDFAPDSPATWASANKSIDADQWTLRLAEMLASGSQYNVSPLHGGMFPGFTSGRVSEGAPGWLSTNAWPDAPIGVSGEQGDAYRAVKRLSTFASHFGQVFAHADAKLPPALMTDASSSSLSLQTLSGSQGSVMFLLREQLSKQDKIEILLPDGLRLPVSLGRDRVAWVVRNVNLAGQAHLDLTNLRPWALVHQKLLVLFGPAGSRGIVSIDGSMVEVDVPKGKVPTVLTVAETPVVVLNHDQVDAATIGPEGLMVGCDGLDSLHAPRPLKGWSKLTIIQTNGNISSRKMAVSKKPTAPALAPWTVADCRDFLDGSSEQYQPIPGPAAMADLSDLYPPSETGTHPFPEVPSLGYGWYHLKLKPSTPQGKLSLGRSGDRLHIYQLGKLAQLVGQGPGATADPWDGTLTGEVTVLVDQLGQFSEGQRLAQATGLTDHLLATELVKLGKPEITSTMSPDPFELAGYVHNRHRNEKQQATTLKWTIKPAGRTKPMLLDLTQCPDCVVAINDTPMAIYQQQAAAEPFRILLDPTTELFSAGKNLLELRFYEPLPDAFKPAKHISLYQATEVVSANATWSFAPWNMPSDEAFRAIPKTTPAAATWYRSSFEVSSTDAPLFVHLTGMSKGQLYLNSHNLCRYFVAPAAGSSAGLVSSYYLPKSCLVDDEPNVLTLFDEHGKYPAKIKLSYNA